MLLIFERLHFLADVLGERVQRRHAFVRRVHERLQLGERSEALADFLHGLHGVVRIFPRVARQFLHACDFLRQINRSRAQAVELSLEALRTGDGFPQLALRLAKLLAHFSQRRLVLLQGLEAGAHLHGLVRDGLQRLPLLLQLAIGRRQLVVLLFCGRDRLGQGFDPCVERPKLLGPRISLGQPFGDLIQTARGFRRLLFNVLQRFSRVRQLGAMELYLRQHRAQRGPFFLRCRDE